MTNRHLVLGFVLIAVGLLLPHVAQAEECKCDKGQQCGVDNQGNPWACSGTGNENTCDIPVGSGVGTCVQCVGNADCTWDSLLTWCSNNTCYHCVIDAHCSNMGEGAICVNQTACGTCNQSKGCPISQVCKNPGTTSSSCVECLTHDDCTNPNNAFCSNNSCGGCSNDDQCLMKFGAETPMCNGGLCVECIDSNDCNDPGMECSSGTCQLLPGCT